MTWKITVLVENTAGKSGVLAEHGLAYFIEAGDEKILFDTGQGMALEHNAKKLGIDLNNLDALILSHGHYDHTGGVHLVSAKKIFAHPAVVDLKFSRNPNGRTVVRMSRAVRSGKDSQAQPFPPYKTTSVLRDRLTSLSHSVAMPSEDRKALLAHPEWIRVEKPVALSNGLRLTGPVPRLTDFEDTGGAFFNDSDCTVSDELPDDQALFFETSSGTVVVLGCAHSGVINTLRFIQTLTDHRPIHTVIGGMHLLHADENRMNRTIEELRQLNVRCLMPCHCTGLPAITRMWNEFPGQCNPCFVGAIINK